MRETGAGPKESIALPQGPRGPFNGTVRSDTVVFTKGLSAGKSYTATVAFETDVNSEPFVITKGICKCSSRGVLQLW